MRVDVLRRNSDVVTLRCAPCFECGQRAVIDVPAEGYARLEGGAYVHTAFPEMSASQRELLISGTHSDCWDKMFPPEGD